MSSPKTTANYFSKLTSILEKKLLQQRALLERLQVLLSSKRYESERMKFRIAERMKELRGVEVDLKHPEKWDKKSAPYRPHGNAFGKYHNSAQGVPQNNLDKNRKSSAEYMKGFGNLNFNQSSLNFNQDGQGLENLDFPDLNLTVPKMNARSIEKKVMLLIKEKDVLAVDQQDHGNLDFPDLDRAVPDLIKEKNVLAIDRQGHRNLDFPDLNRVVPDLIKEKNVLAVDRQGLTDLDFPDLIKEKDVLAIDRQSLTNLDFPDLIKEKTVLAIDRQGLTNLDFPDLDLDVPEMNARSIEEKVMILIKEKGVQAVLELIKKDLNQFQTLPSLEELEKAIFIVDDGTYSKATLRVLYEREKAKLQQIYRLYQYLIDYDRWYEKVIKNILDAIQKRYQPHLNPQIYA